MSLCPLSEFLELLDIHEVPLSKKEDSAVGIAGGDLRESGR
jgi:hypothetical protein